VQPVVATARSRGDPLRLDGNTQRAHCPAQSMAGHCMRYAFALPDAPDAIGWPADRHASTPPSRILALR
jgi:hypothetical protein